VALDASGEGEGIEIAWTPTCGEGGLYELELASDPNFGENVTRIPHISEPGFTIEPALMAASACYWRVAAVDYPHGKRSAFSDRFRVEDVGTPGFAPDAASLGAYPNPARGDVMLRLIIPVDKSIECDIYDVEGRLVATLPMWAGEEGMSATWSTVGSDGKAVPPGVYFAKIKTPGVDLQRKVVLIR
jgi:hypothetical protein